MKPRGYILLREFLLESPDYNAEEMQELLQFTNKFDRH